MTRPRSSPPPSAPGPVAGRRAERRRAPPAGIAVDYGIALAGLPIGTARLAGTFESAKYRVDVSAQLTGLVGAVTGGQGSARSAGNLADKPLPNTFSISTRTSSSGIAVRMALAHGNVTPSEVTPPLIDMNDRVPVTAANKRGIMDPASALLMPAQAAGDLTNPDNCNRTLPVFDGATRFNVVLSYAETRAVEKPGYSGPVLVCNARYGGRRTSAGPARRALHGGESRHVGLARARRGHADARADADLGAHHGRHQHHRGDPLDADRGPAAAIARPRDAGGAPPAASPAAEAACRKSGGSSSFEL